MKNVEKIRSTKIYIFAPHVGRQKQSERFWADTSSAEKMI